MLFCIYEIIYNALKVSQLNKHFSSFEIRTKCILLLLFVFIKNINFSFYKKKSEQQQRILSLETEIEGFKKSIYKEQEQNEKLMTINSKTENDITTMKRLLQICQDRHDALKNEYATYSRMLHETEQALNRANTVSHLSQA